MGGVLLIIGMFLGLLILAISLEAAFKSENEKNLSKGIKKSEIGSEEQKKEE